MPQLLEKPEIFVARVRARKRVYWALGGAVAIHFVFLVTFATVIPLMPDPAKVVRPKPIKLTIERPPEDERQTTMPPQPEEPRERPNIRTNPEQSVSTPPNDARFQSDKDTAAASENPGKEGDEDIPNQEGRELPWFSFETKAPPSEDLPTFGAKAGSAQSEPAPAATPATPQANPPRPQPNLAMVTPKPVPSARELAMLEPQPTPPTPPEDTPQPPEPTPRAPSRESSRAAHPTVQLPGTQAPPGMHPSNEPTKAVGGISNRGMNSVAAIGSPLGRYMKQVQETLAPRWHFLTNKRMDLISIGTVKVKFWINKDGRIESLRLISNTSSETLASASIQAIDESRFPPIPPDLAVLLPGGRLEIQELVFAIY